MLLVKTSKQDVSSMISPAYTVQDVTVLAEPVAASTLIAWSNILQQSQSRLKSAANRRVEAELTIVRLCNMSGENYDTLTGRVEALEKSLQSGVIVKQATPEKKQMPKPKKQQVEEIKEKPEPKAGEPWQHWSKL